MVSILALESFAERHEKWLHALWVVTWAIILTYISLVFLLSSAVSQDDSLRKSFLASSASWAAGLFVLQLIILSSMLPLVHWLLPQLGRWVIGRSLFNLESLLYFLFALAFLPLFIVGIIGIPLVLVFFRAREGFTPFLPFLEGGYIFWYYLFPIVLFISLGILYWRGGRLFRESSAVESKESFFLFTLVTLVHLVGSFLNILFMLVIFQLIEVLLF